MFIDRFIPQLPAAAGTLDLRTGIMLSGDDAPMWRAANVATERVCVLCSARIAAGEYAAHGRSIGGRAYVRCAIDTNGASLERIGAIVGARAFPARGYFDGTVQDSAIVSLPVDSLATVHHALSAQLPGFGCFAILDEAV